MAAKRKKISALAKRESGMLPATLQEHLQKYVTKDAASSKVEIGGFPFISTKAGILMFGDDRLPNPLDVIILGAMRQNVYYGEAEYDDDKSAPPKCFALNFEDDEALMQPPADLDGRMADKCSICPMNKFGSGGRTGRGKACKNRMVLAMLPFEPEANFAKLGGARISVPPTGLKPWGPYAKKVTEGLTRPLFSVITRMGLEPDPKTQVAWSFELVGTIDDEDTLVTLMERVDGDGRQSLEAVPVIGSDDAAPDRPKRGGVVKKRRPVKKAAKKKQARR